MNLAQAIDPERVLDWKPLEVKPAQAAEGSPGRKVVRRRGSLREQLLAELGKGPATVSELHARVGGSKASIGVTLVKLHQDGRVQAAPEGRAYRYALPNRFPR